MAEYVKCHVDGCCEEIPLADYLDIQAYKYGFSNYEELTETGFKLEVEGIYVTS